MPAKGGWHLLRACLHGHAHARVPWSCLHGHTRMHAYHCHTCTAMSTPARVCAYLHVYARLHVRAPSRPCSYPFGHAFDETSVRLWQIKRQSNSLKFQRLGGMGVSVRHRFAMRRRRRQRAQDLPARLKAGHCVCSHILSSNGLATSGYRHQACDVWPAPDSRLLSSRCLSWAGTCICVDSVNVDASTTSTSLGLRPVESRRRGRSRYGGMAGQGTGVGKRERARGACT